LTSRWRVLWLSFVCAGLVLVPGAHAKGHLDRSFGEGGVVDISDDLAPDGWLGVMAVAPDRSIYFTEGHPACVRGGCPYQVLKRYRADGTLDPRFGVSGKPVAKAAMSGASLVVDAAGRPLAAWNQRGGGRGIFIRRFHPNGAPDRSFGHSGTAFVSCGCYLGPLAIAPGGRLLVGGYSESRGGGGSVRTKWFFTRLQPDGKPDRSFGDRGEAWLSVPAYWPPDQMVPLPGTTLLGGFRERGYDASAPYVVRMSSDGRIGHRFAAATRRSLTGIRQTSRSSAGWEGLSLIPRTHGRVDVYGIPFYSKGVALRLLGNGRRDRSFGHGGVTLLPIQTSDAVSDGSGGSFAVGFRRGRHSVLRLGSNGRLDRRFGRVGLPGAFNEYGLQIFASGRGSAVVLARGESTCREICPSHPLMFRLLRG